MTKTDDYSKEFLSKGFAAYGLKMVRRYMALVLLMLGPAICFHANGQTGQNVKTKITGSVVDTSGEPLVGVTVVVRGTQTGTATNGQGWFSIDVPAGHTQLVFSYIGFKETKVNIGAQTSLLVTMESDVTQLDNVVVVGYGFQKKESVIGAISTIDPGMLERNQTNNLSNALSGQIPGIIGYQRSGEPGYDSSDFWIRGISTFGSAGSTPLVIIDGVERDLDRLIPEEIESFSVLKDAAATAVYGVRGANGAIVIRTKRGQLGKPKVTIKGDYGVTAPLKIANYVGAVEHMELINEAARMSGITTAPYDDHIIEMTRTGADPDLYPSVNWLDEVTSSVASNWRVTADVGGGTNLIKYRLVCGVYHENGLVGVKGGQYDNKVRLTKYNVRSNVDINITPSTRFELSIGAYIQDRHAPDTGISTILGNAMSTPPMVHPTIYSNGQIPIQSNRANPWAQATQTGYSRRYDSSVQSVAALVQDVGALWAPLKGLEAKALFSFDFYDRHTITRSRTPDYHLAIGRDADGVLETIQMVDPTKVSEYLDFSKSFSGNRAVYFEVPLTYNRSFGKHTADAMMVWHMRSYINKDVSTAIMSFPYRNAGFAGRFAYDFDTKYFAEFNFGYNGSENFAKGYRYGFFPSVAAGWIISGENFMKPVQNVLSLLRVRTSWGKAGNDQIGSQRRFGYVTLINGKTTGYTFGEGENITYKGIAEDDFGVSNLTWETSTKFNLGLDVELFHSLNVSVDYFTERRENIFMERKTIPELAGFQKTPYANYGKVYNQGMEANVTFNRQFNKDIGLSLMGNFTFARNEIREYDEAAGIVGTSRAKTGQSVSQNYGLIADGLYTDDDFIDIDAGTLKGHLPVPTFVAAVKPGDIRYIDANGDGKITVDDVTAIGRPNVPEIVYGFGFSFRYKNLDISALFQGQAMVDFIISENNIIPGAGMGASSNILSNAYDHWTPENPSQNVFYPRLSYGTNENNKQNSTWWLFNGSFMRLKNFEVGYSVARNRSFIENLRIYVRGTNLLTFSNFKLWDPEQQGNGFKTYPLSRMVSIGLDITFK